MRTPAAFVLFLSLSLFTARFPVGQARIQRHASRIVHIESCSAPSDNNKNKKKERKRLAGWPIRPKEREGKGREGEKSVDRQVEQRRRTTDESSSTHSPLSLLLGCLSSTRQATITQLLAVATATTTTTTTTTMAMAWTRTQGTSSPSWPLASMLSSMSSGRLAMIAAQRRRSSGRMSAQRKTAAMGGQVATLETMTGSRPKAEQMQARMRLVDRC